MKKLMIVAAAAVMAGAAFAEAQVYDMKLKVKTTACKSAKLSKALADLGWFNKQKGETVYFRGSATRTIGGVIWGCDCITISRPSWGVMTAVGNNAQGVSGYAFWDETTSPYTVYQIPFVTFDWAVLNRVGQMANVEGTWVLGDSCDGEAFYFLGAGFGTCTAASSADCEAYIKTMTGNFAGFFQYNFTKGDGCIFCGETVDDCLVAPFCVCANVTVRNTTALTVAYGTWQLKYNASQSKALMKKAFITDVRNCTAKKVANIGAALDAGYLATIQAAAGADVNISAMATKKAKRKDVTPAELAGTGSYYTYLVSVAKQYKNATPVSASKVYKSVDVTTSELPSVAVALIESLGHVESAGAQDAEWEDGGDDSGDDWGDDWGDDTNWDF